ncbi:reverse transcriptase family protein [Sulfurimonas sp.]|uniref:reverse transcriptase family protein n=1 Tax=Sulfurimonas sp. TaxID=2022749 RepID=UPI003D0D8756
MYTRQYAKSLPEDAQLNELSVLATQMLLMPQHYIVRNKIAKKNKKRVNEYREVVDIRPPYNNFYKELLEIFENKVQEDRQAFIHDNVHGFVKGKNILSNAKEHLNKKYIFKIDIKNFFHSINKNDLIPIFKKLGFEDEGAELFSNLCTYNDILKEGFNTSPMLANLYCYDLDKELITLSQKYSVICTRYSDDITFSSDINSFPSIQELEEILNRYGFELNHKKTLLTKFGQSQYVTGLSISNSQAPRVPRHLKKRVRQKLYYLNKFPKDHFIGIDVDKKLRKLYGNIVYILGIEKELGQKYKNQFLTILEQNNYKLSNLFKEAPLKFSANVSHYIDETDIIVENKKRYLALSVVSILHDELKRNNTKELNQLKDEMIKDFRNGLSDLQKSKLFHYAEDNIYAKEKYIAKLRELPFEAFIIYMDIGKVNLNKQEYQEAYYKVFNLLMYNVLRRYRNYQNIIFFEENSKISQEKLRNNLENIQSIPKFKLSSATKQEILLSIPDYILGIFRDCIKKDLTNNIASLKNGQTLKEENRLHEVLEKIRLVIDLNNKKYYARQEQQKLNCREINQAIIEDLK